MVKFHVIFLTKKYKRKKISYSSLLLLYIYLGLFSCYSAFFIHVYINDVSISQNGKNNNNNQKNKSSIRGNAHHHSKRQMMYM